MNERPVGYILLISGVAIIAFAMFSVYQVFTKKTKPVQLFNFPAISLDLSQATQVEVPQNLKDAGIKINNQPNKQEILPANLLNDSSNIIAHVILMGFIVNAGFKIALLGAEIVRPVIVKTSSYKVTAKDGVVAQTPLEAKLQKR